MRRAAAWTGLFLVAAVLLCASARGQHLLDVIGYEEPLGPDEALKVYAVNVVKTTPFQQPFTGNGIFLGKGAVLTAAHVIGRWGFLKRPRVLIGGLDLRAKIIKEGSLEQTDLTLLSVDEALLPVSLRLRRNPLCEGPLSVGSSVIVAAPEKTQRSSILSPQWIDPEHRTRFGSLTSELAGSSGSGVFDTRKRCLLGIVSRQVQKYNDLWEDGQLVRQLVGTAGYFIPSWEIRDFLPAEFRF